MSRVRAREVAGITVRVVRYVSRWGHVTEKVVVDDAVRELILRAREVAGSWYRLNKMLGYQRFNYGIQHYYRKARFMSVRKFESLVAVVRGKC